ncbi:MAG: DNA-binding transcriptional ArsR family regulator [Polyangiales bacterium]|jgi:DNA-binding transcriptional ArsR family regulator
MPPNAERHTRLKRLYEAGGVDDEELSEEDGAWAHALYLQRWLGGRGHGTEVEPSVPPEALQMPQEREPAAGVFALCMEMRRAATLRFDGAGVVAAVAQARQLAQRYPQECDELSLRLNAAWEAWVVGAPNAVHVEAIAQTARERANANAAVEAQVLRGLHELAEGLVTNAVQSLRRASRMARVEGVPDLEVLAGIALARARRFQGRPQLALRILRAVAPHAPAPWNRWLSWEATLAGARFASGRTDESVLGALLRACDASEEGHPEGSRASLDALLTGAEHFVSLRHEARSAAALLSVGEYSEAPEEVAAWISGEVSDVPPALRGFVFASHIEEGGESCALLLAPLQGRARRVLARSLRLAMAQGVDPSPAAAPTHPRTDSGLATLAFEAGALPLGSYFESVYVYAFDPSVHRSMVNMHVRRMRERIGESADIEREGDTIALRLVRSLMLRDARCEETIEDRVLGVLARSDSKSATELARELKIPLRSVQRILRELQVDAGVEQRKEGRNVRYAVEDTTFSEPTRTRRFEPVMGRE